MRCAEGANASHLVYKTVHGVRTHADLTKQDAKLSDFT